MGFSKDENRGKKDLIDVLFDKNNLDDILLVNEKGQELAFKQIYAVELDGELYCILAPVEKIGLMSPDDALAFWAFKSNTLSVVKDYKLSRRIFSNYYNYIQNGGKYGV